MKHVWNNIFVCSKMEERRLPISDKRRQKLQDERLWKRKEQRAALYNLKRFHCPCSKCKGRVQCSLAKVKDHLIQHGREPTYRLWRGPSDRDSLDEEWEQEFKTPSRTRENVQLDIDLDVRSMVQDAFQEIDERPPPLEETMEEILMDAFTVVDDLQDGENDDSGDEDNEESLGDVGIEHDMDDDPHELEDAIQELYEGAKSSILAATILIMTLCTIHGVSNKFADQLFALFSLHLLPGENRLPKNYHAAKSMFESWD